MANLKDQIQQQITKQRERSREPQPGKSNADEAADRLDEIRPRLDELAHTTDEYSLSVEYTKGPYAADVAVLELETSRGAWVAAWQVGAMVSGSVRDWEVTYNPRGVETQHEWFRSADDLFAYLTTSIAERVVQMEADEA